MHYIQGKDRFQITFSSLDGQICKDNPVRVIDAFIEKLDLELLGFVSKPPKPKVDQEQKTSNPMDGRPSFHPKTLLKLYFYGYFNGIRSSRRLERECGRNIEVRWLIGELAPNYHTIADTSTSSAQASVRTIPELSKTALNSTQASSKMQDLSVVKP